MARIVFASNNAGKVVELATLLADSDLELVPQSNYGVPAVEETGLTFIENALLKARHAARQTGLPAIGDDSGLAVDALGGAPGIYSARFAGPGADDNANNRKLLAELAAVPEDQRSARFHCLLVFLRHADDPTPLICQGSWEGVILNQPRGANGFGYDPLFLVPTHGGSAAELDPAVKNGISHRGQAVRALIARLRELARTGT